MEIPYYRCASAIFFHLFGWIRWIFPCLCVFPSPCKFNETMKLDKPRVYTNVCCVKIKLNESSAELGCLLRPFHFLLEN